MITLLVYNLRLSPVKDFIQFSSPVHAGGRLLAALRCLTRELATLDWGSESARSDGHMCHATRDM